MRHNAFALMILVVILLCALIVHALSQTPAPVQCFTTQVAEKVMPQLERMPGVSVLKISGEEFERFMQFLRKNGAVFPAEEASKLNGAILADLAAGVDGEARMEFILLRNQEPKYCLSPAFRMPANIGAAALEAIYGRKS